MCTVQLKETKTGDNCRAAPTFKSGSSLLGEFVSIEHPAGERTEFPKHSIPFSDRKMDRTAFIYNFLVSAMRLIHKGLLTAKVAGSLAETAELQLFSIIYLPRILLVI